MPLSWRLDHPCLLLVLYCLILLHTQGAKGSPEDKLRLALVHLLAAESAPSEAELQELTAALSSAGVPDTTALVYVARLRRNRLVGSARPAPGRWFVAISLHAGVSMLVLVINCSGS